MTASGLLKAPPMERTTAPASVAELCGLGRVAATDAASIVPGETLAGKCLVTK
jgi:hypothetical protein